MSKLILRSLVSKALRASHPLAAGSALLALSFSGAALAQQQASTAAPAPSETLEEVVVTGIRHGIQAAIELKRDSGSIVEAVSAEDIGKLPDTSIAESISRLPGLTSQRAEGRASAISLRGTDPGFTTALLNGREQVSTGDNRSIEFDQYPSELLSGVVVYKTPDAQLVGQGLAGTIDLRTTRPLEYGKSAIVFNVRGERNSNNDLGADSKANGYRASFSYINQFLDNTLGVTFGVARLESPLATKGAGTYEPWKTNGTPGVPDGSLTPTAIINPGVGPNDYITDGMKVRTDMGKNRRDGVMAALEWRPNASFTSTLDLYATKRDQVDNARSLEANFGCYPALCSNWPQGDGAFPVNTVFGFSNPTISDSTVVAATLNQRVPLVRNFLFKTQDKITAFGWNNKWSEGGWTVVGDLSYSKATRDEQQYETNAQYLPNLDAAAGTTRNIYDSGSFSVAARDNMPTMSFNNNYADPTKVQLGGTIYGAGYSKIPHVEDKLKSARIDVGHTLGGWFADVAAGLNYSDRSKDKLQPEGGLSTNGGNWYQIDSRYLLAPTNLGYAGAGQVLAWDVPSVLAAYYLPMDCAPGHGCYATPATGAPWLIGKNWGVKEKIATAFVKGNLDHELSASVTLKGNVGLQFVRTDQSSTAFYRDNSAGGAVKTRTAGKTFTDVLPAINLAFMLPDQQAVRVGLARELARPRMDQLKASSELGYDAATGRPGGSGGNPMLDPWRADAFDVSYEKYFSNKAYVSAAAFYKKLKSYVYNQTNASYDFSSYLATIPSSYFPNGVVPQLVGSFTQPVNGQGGDLKGIELSASLPGDMITDALSGFGTILSFSQTESGISIQDPPGNDFVTGTGLGTIPLPGLSKTVWSATLYYEKAGFSARVATRARSKYIGEVTNFANDRAFRYIKADRITDLQTGYEFQSGPMKGLSLLLQVNNVTNAPYIAYTTSEARVLDHQEYGRQFLLGLNYKL
jgi:TonB-dependent receptor